MKSTLLVASAIFLSQLALGSEAPSKDEQEIRDVFTSLTDAWRNADGEAWGIQRPLVAEQAFIGRHMPSNTALQADKGKLS